MGREGSANKGSGPSNPDICHEHFQVLAGTIHATISKFWWGHKQEERKIHWLSRLKLCQGKEDGGFGFRDMEAFNDALLAKQGWCLLKNSDSLPARLLKARYFPTTSFLDADLGSRLSYVWRRIWGVREVVTQGSRWLIGNGKDVNFWQDRWILRPVTFKLITTKPPDTQLFHVSDLIDTNLGGWNDDLVKRSFLPCNVEAILNIPLCLSWPADKLVWHYTTSGVFSVRSAYHLIMANKSSRIGCSRMDDNKF